MSNRLLLGIVTADQFVKIVVIQNHLPYRFNTGGAFSLLANFGGYTTFALGTLIILLTWGLGDTRQRKVSRTTKTGWALLRGGALSNTLDRLLHGGVIDFLQVGPFPTFNPADTAIVLGLLIIISTVLTSPANRSYQSLTKVPSSL